jgi:hypothetical protein
MRNSPSHWAEYAYAVVSAALVCVRSFKTDEMLTIFRM